MARVAWVCEADMHGLDGNPRSVIPRTRTTRHQFAFGGVAFEVLADKGVEWALREGYERHVVPADSTPVVADVICSVSVDRLITQAGEHSTRGFCFREVDGRRGVFSRELRAELSRVAPSRYAATARIIAGGDGLSALLLGLASAIVQAEGGLNVHAAAVELAGQALLFLGPSGAGKSTAASLCAGANVFAYDRVSVVCRAGRLFALSLPGGSAIEGTPSDHHCLPVAALLRVRRGLQQPSLQRLDGAAALFAVRESIEVSDTSTLAEEQRLGVATQVCESAPIYEIRTVLGHPLTTFLQDGLSLAAQTPQPQGVSQYALR
jgi:hypothetical protein